MRFGLLRTKPGSEISASEKRVDFFLFFVFFPPLFDSNLLS